MTSDWSGGDVGAINPATWAFSYLFPGMCAQAHTSTQGDAGKGLQGSECCRMKVVLVCHGRWLVWQCGGISHSLQNCITKTKTLCSLLTVTPVIQKQITKNHISRCVRIHISIKSCGHLRLIDWFLSLQTQWLQWAKLTTAKTQGSKTAAYKPTVAVTTTLDAFLYGLCLKLKFGMSASRK